MPHLHLDQYNLDQFRPPGKISFCPALPLPPLPPAPSSMPHLHLGSIHSINSTPQVKFPSALPLPPLPRPPPLPPSPCPLPSAVPSPPSGPPPQCLTFIWDQYIRSILPPGKISFRPSSSSLPPTPLPTVPSLPPSP